MPEAGANASSLFQQAANAVAAWLDGAGSSFATREISPGAAKQGFSWKLAPIREGVRARLVLPRDFPATTAQIYVDKQLCLQHPHVEEDGRLCLGVAPKPGDYDSPAHAVADVLKAFDEYLEKLTDPRWIEEEFHRERSAYWLRFCEAVRVRHKLNIPTTVKVDLGAFDAHRDGDLAVYHKDGRSMRPIFALATNTGSDANVLSYRHGWAKGTLRKGHALFVKVPDDTPWTPSTWATSFFDLERLVFDWTGGELSLVDWLKGKKDDRPRPYLVVCVQGSAAFGYYLLPPLVPPATSPIAAPVPLERVDFQWGLARDHELPKLERRRQKKIFLLGVGSLGAPIAELLARAGIGQLDLADMQLFKSENTSRHLLGYSSIDHGKAIDVTLMLRKEIPGAKVNGKIAMAASYLEVALSKQRYDLVIDCTGESPVRTLLSRLSASALRDVPVAMAWSEPMCAAGHLVWLDAGEAWPADDPADEKVNVAQWSDDTAIHLPACGVSFHPYGASDIWQVAAFCCERILAHIDEEVAGSTVWTWTHGSKFFEELGHLATPGPRVPATASKFDTVSFQRAFRDLAHEA